MSLTAFGSSPAELVFQSIRSNATSMIKRFVASCKDSAGHFQIETAKVKLRDLWNSERTLLKATPQYAQLRRERQISDAAYPAECIYVDTDYLGHLSLCFLEHFQSWKTYALEFHRNDIERLAGLGSWKAVEWFKEVNAPFATITEEEIATRFFLGDLEMMKALTQGYSLSGA